MTPLLTKREREFIQDWLKVVRGELKITEFYSKWGSRKKEDNSTMLQDLERVESGEMSLEEFRRKWTRKGDWKNYVRVMRHRLDKKRKNVKKILKKIDEDIRLLQEFFNCEMLP